MGLRDSRTTKDWTDFLEEGLVQVADRQLGATVVSAAAAILTTPDLRPYGFPYKSVIFTKSAGAVTTTITWQAAYNSFIFSILNSGAETITLAATNDDDGTIGAVPVTLAAGTFDDGTLLGDGTYAIRSDF